MRRLCQFERVPCESCSIRRTVCPPWIAARARPMASVLLPLPPFWVANTIVYIVGSFGLVLRDLQYALLLHRILRCRALPLRTAGALRKNVGDRGCPNHQTVRR